MSPLIATERLEMREVTLDDAPFVLELLSSRGFIEGIADRGVRTVDDARAYIAERIHGAYREHGFGMWAVVETASGEAVGLAGLVRREVLPHVDVGYAFLERAWGKGYAQEAAAGVMRHARAAMGFEILCAIVNPENVASQNVLRKVGFRYVDTRELPGWDGPSLYFTT